MTEKKRLEKEIALDASPEQVWHAVSTAEGFSTWFVPHYSDDDGNIVGDFGSGNESTGVLVEQDPGRRIVFASENDGAQETLEFIVEGRDESTTVLRLIQSGDLGEDWQIEQHSRGWDMFFHNLREYLAGFAGQPVTNVLALNMTSMRSAEVWETFHRELGITADAKVGDKVTATTPEGLPPIDGVIDLKGQGMLGIRSGNGLHRFGGEGADTWGMVNVVHYYYGVHIDRDEATRAWQAWLDRLFPAAT